MGIYGHAFDDFIYFNKSELLNNLCEKIYMESESLFNSEEILDESIINTLVKTINFIKTILNNIKTANKLMILDYNKYKCIKLPEDMNKDLVEVLNATQLRTLPGIEQIPLFFQYLLQNKNLDITTKFSDEKLDRSHGMKSETTIEFEIDKTIVDLKQSIKTYSSMPEYKRLKECKYQNENIKSIPINIIISNIKECTLAANNFENNLLKLSTIDTSKLNKTELRVYNKLLEYDKLLVKYFNDRIQLLNIYLNNAKLTARSMFNYFKRCDDTNGINQISNVLIDKASNMHYFYKIEINSEQLSILFKWVQSLLTANKEKRYDDYKNYHKDFCKYLGTNPESTIHIFSFKGNENNPDTWSGQIRIDKNDYSAIPVAGRPLYHHSTESSNLTELNPTAVGNWEKTFYPEPRVYVHISMPLTKAGKKVDAKYDYKDKDGNIIKDYMYKNRTIYKIIDNIEKVYVDPEMGGTGSFIVSEKPIKVKKINYEQWKKENNVN